MIVVPMRTSNGLNSREHWRSRAARVKREREGVAWMLAAERVTKPEIPCSVRLTRVAPSNGLDTDNLAGSLKAARDQVAAWLGLDDRDSRVQWLYEQRRGPWAVEIEFGQPVQPRKFISLMESF